MLRWHPDCVAWFDYTTTPYPTLHIRRRANLAAVALPVGVAPLSSVKGITPRNDLVPPSVVIHYEITGSSNGQSTFNLAIDAAPTTATGAEFGAVCCTIPLRGTTATSVQQRVVTRDLLGQSHELHLQPTARLPDRQERRHGDQGRRPGGHDGGHHDHENQPGAGRSQRQVAQSQRRDGRPTPVTGVLGPQMIPAVYDPTLVHELVEGSITDWMRKNYAIRAQVQSAHPSRGRPTAAAAKTTATMPTTAPRRTRLSRERWT